jgi:hypothetical protein
MNPQATIDTTPGNRRAGNGTRNIWKVTTYVQLAEWLYDAVPIKYKSRQYDAALARDAVAALPTADPPGQPKSSSRPRERKPVKGNGAVRTGLEPGAPGRTFTDLR